MRRRAYLLPVRELLLLPGAVVEAPDHSSRELPLAEGDHVLVALTRHDDAELHPLATLAEVRHTPAGPRLVGLSRYRLDPEAGPDEAGRVPLDARRDLPELGVRRPSEALSQLSAAHLASPPTDATLASLAAALAPDLSPAQRWHLQGLDHPEALDLGLRRVLAVRLVEAADPELRRLALEHLDPGDSLETRVIDAPPRAWCLVEPAQLEALGRGGRPVLEMSPAEVEALTESGLLVGIRHPDAGARLRIGPPLGRAAQALLGPSVTFYLRVHGGRLQLLDAARGRDPEAPWVSIPPGEYDARVASVGVIGRRVLGATHVLELEPARRRGRSVGELPRLG